MNDAADPVHSSGVPAANIVYEKRPSGRARVPDRLRRLRQQRLQHQGARPTSATAASTCAGAILQQLYGPLNPRNNARCRGSFIEFNQTAVHQRPRHGGHRLGLRAARPAPPARSARLHVALHGCQQNTADVGDKFVQQHRLHALGRHQQHRRAVPADQATAPRPTNSCWDWCGLRQTPTSRRRAGTQMAAIKAMVDRVPRAAAAARRPTLPAPTGVGTSGATSSSMVIALERRSAARPATTSTATATRSTRSPVAGTSYTDTGLAAGTTYSWTVSGGRRATAPRARRRRRPAAPRPAARRRPRASPRRNYAHTTAGRAHHERRLRAGQRLQPEHGAVERLRHHHAEADRHRTTT